MIKSAQMIDESVARRPILIVDKKGIIGEALAKRLAGDFLVVLVSSSFPKSLLSLSNIVHVKFTKRAPQIPDNIYSEIFLIQDEESLLKESLENFVLKAKRDDASLYYLSWIGNSEENLLEAILSRGKKAKIFLYGDLFDKKVVLNPHSVIGKYLNDIFQKGRIEVEKDGLGASFPIFLGDFIESILNIAFKDKDGQIFYAFNQVPITDLSLSRIFKKHDPDLKVDFKKNNNIRKTISIPAGGEFVVKTDLDKRIAEVISDRSPREEVYLTKKEEEHFLRSYFLWIFIIFLFFLSLPLLTTLSYAYLGKNELTSVKNYLNNGDLISAKQSSSKASSFFDISTKTGIYLKSEASIIGLSKRADELNNQISLGKKVADASYSLISSIQIYKTIGEGNSNDPNGDFNNAQNLLKNSISDFREIQTLASVSPDLESKISEIKPIIDLASSSIDLPQKLLGFDKARKYLILFQNNMELRPTGGFIGSYGILTVDKGQIKDFTIHDVYDADGQLKAHVEPPFPIRRFMQIPHLYLRDSNFDISFADAAPVSADLLNLELNQKVDGVGAIDLNVAQRLLKLTGPVNVSDYNVTLTSDNFFAEVESHVEKNFFPGSTQKKDFLRSAFNAISEKLSSNKISYFDFAKIILSSLSQKDIILASSDKSVQAIFSENGWSDDLLDNRKDSPYSINDYMGINEANIGVNKVNYFVSRSVTKTAEIQEDGSMVENTTVEVKNNSSKKNNQNYVSYLRLVVPIGSTLSSISIDGANQLIVPAITDPLKFESKNFKPPVGFEVDQYIQDNKKIIGFLINVGADSTKKISVSYILPNKINIKSPSITYDLIINKQPGVESYPLDFTLIYPDSLKVISKPQNFVVDDKTSFIGNINSDMDFTIKLGQK